MGKKSRPPQPPPADPRSPWLRALLTALVAGCVLSLASFKVVDPDIWWHLRTGQWILAHRAVPRADIFSYTIPGHPWITFEWLSQVLFYGAYLFGGLTGLILFKAAVLSLVFVCVFLDAGARKPLPLLAAAVLVVLAACGARTEYAERPQIFTFLLTAVYLAALKRGEERPAFHYGLPALQVLWCNLHGGASVVGLALVGGWWAGALIQKSSAGRRLGLVLLGCAAASLANPNGWQIYSQLFGTLGFQAREAISEWQPLRFSAELRPIWIPLIALEAASAAAWLGNPRRRAGAGLLWLAFFFLSFRALRFTVEALPVFAQLGAGDLAAALEGRRLGRLWPAVAAAVVAAMLAGTWAFATYAFPGSFWPGFGVVRDAGDAIAFMDKAGLKGPLFNSYGLGGQLIWRSPGRKVFVDGRSLEYGPAFVSDAVRWFRPDVWTRLDGRYHFQLALIDQHGPGYTCGVLDDDPRWRLVYWDDSALVYVRADGVNAAAARAGYRYLRPNELDFGYLDAEMSRSPAAVIGVLSELDRSIAAAPAHLNPLLLKGYVLSRLGMTEPALKVLEQAIAVAPGRPEPYYQSAMVLQRLGRDAEAEPRYREASRLALRFGDLPLRVDALNNLGILAVHRGDRSQAVALWSKAVELDPADEAARRNLAAVGQP